MTALDVIIIRGVKTHNLKNLNVKIPRDKLTVITGPSGSGKSSLAFDTLYAEGQRRYVESLSSYARQFLTMMAKPVVDSISGLSPAIAIEQKTSSHNPRSTVGTITEIYDYLRLLYARIGEPRCPEHGLKLRAQTVSQMVDEILLLPPESKAMILAPIVRGRKGEYIQLFQKLQTQGYLRARIDGELIDLEELPKLAATKKHNIDVVVDRFRVRKELAPRLSESIENALSLSDGLVSICSIDGSFPELIFSSKFACADCGYSLSELEPRLFSFNNPAGACETCLGLGIDQFIDPLKVIADPSKAIANGALRGWDYKTSYVQNLLSSLTEHYGFDVHTPFGELAPEIQKIILYGSGKELIKFRYQRKDSSFIKTHVFEGLIPNMQRRYYESESSAIKEELAKYLSNRPCASCFGTRLCLAARNVFIKDINLPAINAYSIEHAYNFFTNLGLTGTCQEIGEKIINEITLRLQFLLNVGLNYLSLSRNAETLSGGETQRIRLASQIGSGLMGVMYILDEPSIGLHARDNERLINTLLKLRNLGNTVIVVEHDENTILAADFILDMGPGAGIYGGDITASGSPAEIKANPESLTGQYLTGKKQITINRLTIEENTGKNEENLKETIIMEKVNCNNLKDLTVTIPTKIITCITGVSGSGKSSLINDTLYPLLANKLNGSNTLISGTVKEIKGLEYLDKVIAIDQAPIGRTPRSNPATYTGIFTLIRELFAATPMARMRGYSLGRFSFNVPGGRCEGCQGDGEIKVEMHFLPDIYVTCDLCQGKKYSRETLEVCYKGKNIYEILMMSIEEANQFFKAIPLIQRKCQTLLDVGLGYLCLGQNATTLSGGEAQRLKLSRELAKRSTGKTLYILDEPTTGLHFQDIQQLLNVLFRLKAQGNTIIIIEHNLDVIKTADWVIDLGPEGGERGGKVIVTGPPALIANCAESYTGQFLRSYYNNNSSIL